MTELTDVQLAVPVLETKLRRPSPSLLLVTRSRLLDQLTTWLDRRLILAVAIRTVNHDAMGAIELLFRAHAPRP
jgi:hypothetical protein